MQRKKSTLRSIPDVGRELQRIVLGRGASGTNPGGTGFFSLAVLALLGVLGFQGGHSLRTAQLEREKSILVTELAAIRGRVVELEGNITFLADRDAELRLLAGLEPIDPEVLQVGVGGPGQPNLEGHALFELNEEVGKETFAVTYDLNALERRSRLLRESILEASDSLAAHRDLLESTPSILPTAGRLTSGFSNARMHPIHNQALPHEGLDISAPRGTPIMAAANGRVTFAGTRAGYGLVVEVDHGFGYMTRYGHASRIVATRGQVVSRGEVIAEVGSTGIATAPHLHYEVLVNNRPVNPVNFIISGAIP